MTIPYGYKFYSPLSQFDLVYPIRLTVWSQRWLPILQKLLIRQPFEWNYFPLVNERIVLSSKKRNLGKYSVVFFLKHFPKKRYLADPVGSVGLLDLKPRFVYLVRHQDEIWKKIFLRWVIDRNQKKKLFDEPYMYEKILLHIYIRAYNKVG